MAKIHIIKSPSRGVWEGFVHFLVPAGSNTVGIPWKTILLENYPNLEPAAFGDETEKQKIIAGDIVEISVSFYLNPDDMEVSVLQAALNKVAEDAIVQWRTEPLRAHQYSGYSQGVVS